MFRAADPDHGRAELDGEGADHLRVGIHHRAQVHGHQPSRRTGNRYICTNILVISKFYAEMIIIYNNLKGN